MRTVGRKIHRVFGFKGLISNISDELLPAGYVPDMENMTIETEGLAENLPNPTEVDIWKGVGTWVANVSVSVDKIIFPATSNGHFYICTTAGTTGSTEPTWTTVEGNTTTDNTAVWTEAGLINGSIKQIYYWQSFHELIVRVGGDNRCTVVLVGQGYGHIFCNSLDATNYPLSFAPDPNQWVLYIMSKEDGLWKTTGNQFFDVSSPSEGIPPKSCYILTWHNRLWAFGFPKLPDGSEPENAILYSDLPGDPEEDPQPSNTGFEYWDPINIIKIGSTGENIITAAIPFKQSLLVTTRNAMYSLFGYIDSSVNAFRIKPLLQSKDSPITNQYAYGDSVYYFVQKGMRKLGEFPEDISLPIENLLPSLSFTQGNAGSDLFTRVQTAYWKNRIYFLVDGVIYAYHIFRKTWEKYNYPNANCIASGDHLYLGTTDGKVYELDVPASGYLSWYIKTPHYIARDLYIEKRFLNVKVYYKTTVDSSLLKGYFYTDYSDSGTALTDKEMQETNSGEMREEAQQTICDKAKAIQYKFYGDGEAKIAGYDVEYKERWRRRV